MQQLLKYQKISLDLDGTLIDGIASDELVQFVQQHPEKTFYIVTFRTSDQCHSVPQELKNVGLSETNFQSIMPISKRLTMEFDADQQQRRMAKLPSIDQVDDHHLFPGEYRFVHWKGFICRKLGATVLVDDMPYLVQPGCTKFHVDLIPVNVL